MPNLYEDPQLERKRQLAQMLMQQGTNPQPVAAGQYGVWNGLADLSKALLGAYQTKKLDEQDAARRTSLHKTLAEALTGPAEEQQPGFVGPPQDRNDFMIRTLAGNPDTAETALQFQLKRQMADAEGEAQFRRQRALLDARGKDVPDPYFSPVQTSGGLFKFDARTGRYEPMVDRAGNPLLPPAIDAAAQGAVASAKAGGKTRGTSQAEAEIELPGILQQADYAKSVIDKLIDHPGRSTITGRSAHLGEFAGKVGLSTDAAGALALKKQIEGEAFLQAFQSLKGGGHITEIEGEKATQARARLLSTQDEGEFIEALRELKALIDMGTLRARTKAGGGPNVTVPAPTSEGKALRYNPATGKIE